MPQTLTLNPGPTKEPLGFLWGMPKAQTLSHGPTLEPLQSFLVGGLNCTCALKPNPVRVHRRSLFLATYFACQDNLSTIREPSQLLAILLELSERKAQKKLPRAYNHWNDGRRSFTTHVDSNMRTLSANSKMNPSALVVSIVQPALVSWDSVMARFQDGAGCELRFKTDALQSWPGIGAMENSHTLVMLGACGLLDTADADEHATCGPNVDWFLNLCCVTDVRSKRASSWSLSDVARKVSTLINEDVSAAMLQGSICKFMQVLSCFICGKTFGRARVPDNNQVWRLSSSGCKLLKLKRRFEASD